MKLTKVVAHEILQFDSIRECPKVRCSPPWAEPQFTVRGKPFGQIVEFGFHLAPLAIVRFILPPLANAACLNVRNCLKATTLIGMKKKLTASVAMIHKNDVLEVSLSS